MPRTALAWLPPMLRSYSRCLAYKSMPRSRPAPKSRKCMLGRPGDRRASTAVGQRPRGRFSSGLLRLKPSRTRHDAQPFGRLGCSQRATLGCDGLGQARPTGRHCLPHLAGFAEMRRHDAPSAPSRREHQPGRAPQPAPPLLSFSPCPLIVAR